MAVAPPNTLFDEVTDFLLSGPTPEQIIEFQPSEALNQRLHDLLDKNSEESLNPEERDELNRFLEIGHLFTILKAKARLKLMGKA
jgi:hypothetical protein